MGAPPVYTHARTRKTFSTFRVLIGAYTHTHRGANSSSSVNHIRVLSTQTERGHSHLVQPLHRHVAIQCHVPGRNIRDGASSGGGGSHQLVRWRLALSRSYRGAEDGGCIRSLGLALTGSRTPSPCSFAFTTTAAKRSGCFPLLARACLAKVSVLQQ